MIYSILMMCDLQCKMKALLRTGPERRVTEAAPSSLFCIATITIRISITIRIIVFYHAHTA